MKKLKHTPGPWIYEVKAQLINVVIPNGNGHYKRRLTLGVLNDDDCTFSTCCKVEEHANAKLIATAPEMLEALQETLDFLGHIQPKIGEQAFNTIYEIVESAYKKATNND